MQAVMATTQKKGVSGLFCAPPSTLEISMLSTRKPHISCTSVGVLRVSST